MSTCQHPPGPVQRRFINNIIITTSRLSPSLQVAACGGGRMRDFIRVIQHKRCFGHLQIQFLHSQTERRRRPPCITLPSAVPCALGQNLADTRMSPVHSLISRSTLQICRDSWQMCDVRQRAISTFYLILSEPFDFCEINVFIFLICQLAGGLMGRSSGHFLSAQL